MAAVILHVIRKKCEHGEEIRMFKAIDGKKTFSELKLTMRCHPEGMMAISVSSKEGGWGK